MEWRDVEGMEGAYQVSATGLVRSVDRRWPVVNRFGNIEHRRHSGKLLHPSKLKNGYLTVSLTLPGRPRRYAYVHHLVAHAFIGPRPEGCEVCHNDGSRDNNDAGNLRYDTRSANALDRHAHNTMNQERGETHYYAKLTEADVRWIRANNGALSQRAMAEILGVTHGTVGSILRGQAWKHVSPSCNASL